MRKVQLCRRLDSPNRCRITGNQQEVRHSNKELSTIYIDQDRPPGEVVDYVFPCLNTCWSCCCRCGGRLLSPLPLPRQLAVGAGHMRLTRHSWGGMLGRGCAVVTPLRHVWHRFSLQVIQAELTICMSHKGHTHRSTDRHPRTGSTLVLVGQQVVQRGRQN